MRGSARQRLRAPAGNVERQPGAGASVGALKLDALQQT